MRARWILTTSLVVAAVLAPAVAVAQTDWPQLQRDAARSGYSPDSVGVPDGGEATVVWRWHPDNQTSLHGRTQPVIANGLVCAGFFDGKMYARNTSDGSEAWTYQAGGSITHTAAMDATKVYFGSTDGKLYAVNQSDGSEAWTFDTGAPIYTAPCLANGVIYIGNAEGRFYAINADGTEAWTQPYQSLRPIRITAAYSNGKIFCGDEGLYAFCLDATNDGSELWRVRLEGQSMWGYWPVVIDQAGVVIYRTQGVRPFHFLLNNAEPVLGGGTGTGDYGDGTAQEIADEQTAIRNYLDANPDEQTMWALNISNGQEAYTPPIFYTAGEGTTPVPPIFNPATGEAWVVCRTLYSRLDDGSMVRRFAEIAKFDPNTGNYSLFGTAATINDLNIHLIGDETTIITADAWGVLASGRGTLGYMRHSPEETAHVLSSDDNSVDDYFHVNSPLAYGASPYPSFSVEAGGGSGGGLCNGAAVAQNSLYWFARWGLLCRIDRQ